MPKLPNCSSTCGTPGMAYRIHSHDDKCIYKDEEREDIKEK